ncbi:S24 family peptidase [Gallibacterium anatis]|uniref:LexA family transcriptional regulator n=1 Tax=Gallibacterium anatis TaxID=750 RepID=UPI00068B159C|nr:S24 family peptidase [Gallibacterium anatis]
MNDKKETKAEAIIRRMLEVSDFKRETDLANYLQIGKSSISNWKTNNKVPASHILNLAIVSGVNPIWLKTGEGNKFDDIRITNPAELDKYENSENMNISTLISSESDDEHYYCINQLDVKAAAATKGFENEDYPEIIRSIYFSPQGLADIVGKKKADNLFLITVPTDSMEPTIKKGDLVFIDASINYYNTEGIYIFALNGATYIKRLMLLPTNVYKALSDNPLYPDFDIDGNLFDTAQIIGKFIRVLPINPRDL